MSKSLCLKQMVSGVVQELIGLIVPQNSQVTAMCEVKKESDKLCCFVGRNKLWKLWQNQAQGGSAMCSIQSGMDASFPNKTRFSRGTANKTSRNQRSK